MYSTDNSPNAGGAEGFAGLTIGGRLREACAEVAGGLEGGLEDSGNT